MRILVQRVSHAKVTVDQMVVGSIQKGLLVFVGVTHDDKEEQAAWLANKLLHLRLFADAEGKLNHSVFEEKAEVLVISQFTLYADCADGRRPSFTQAAPPEQADHLYMYLVEEMRKNGLKVETGIFGANMQVELVNDGPVTIMLER